MSVDYKYVCLLLVLLLEMNHSYLITRDEASDLEQHIRALLCSDGKHLSLVVEQRAAVEAAAADPTAAAAFS